MKFFAIVALVSSTTAIRNFPPFYSYNVPVDVDSHNWPGSILPGSEPLTPKASSFVDDEYDPLLNVYTRYNVGSSVGSLMDD